MRMESRVGSKTRIEVLTEGVMTRMLQRDPSLEGVGLVIFDEFHQRSLAADLALALCLDIQGVLNPSLRILAMSATLDVESLLQVMEGAQLLSCNGRQFDVETVYLGQESGRGDLAERMARAVYDAVGRYPGGILAFLPGAGEIKKAARLLSEADLASDCRVMPLYGNLTRAEQQRAVEPGPAGRRKIVLATDIAETSLTIEGIRCRGGRRLSPRAAVRYVQRHDTVAYPAGIPGIGRSATRPGGKDGAGDLPAAVGTGAEPNAGSPQPP